MPSFTPPVIVPGFRADLVLGIQSMPASRLIGLKVLGFAPEGLSVIELPITGALTFDGRIVQGGIVGMLADYAGVSAAACTLPEGWMASTTGYEVHNISPAKGERLLAIGHAINVGKSHAVSRAEVWAQADGASTLVCVATTTCKPFEFRSPSA
jgi:uncharacterized protein (TIGR00369 family)